MWRNKKKKVLWLLLAVGCMPINASADDRFPVGVYLQANITIAEGKCPDIKKQVKELKSKGETALAQSIEEGAKSLCECMPTQSRKLMAELPVAEQARAVTEQEFLSRYKALLIDVCAARQLRAMYGEGCAERFKELAAVGPKYCGCMRDHIRGLSDAEITDIGLMSADYIPLAAEAKKNGKAPPDPRRY